MHKLKDVRIEWNEKSDHGKASAAKRRKKDDEGSWTVRNGTKTDRKREETKMMIAKRTLLEGSASVTFSFLCTFPWFEKTRKKKMTSVINFSISNPGLDFCWPSCTFMPLCLAWGKDLSHT